MLSFIEQNSTLIFYKRSFKGNHKLHQFSERLFTVEKISSHFDPRFVSTEVRTVNKQTNS